MLLLGFITDSSAYLIVFITSNEDQFATCQFHNAGFISSECLPGTVEGILQITAQSKGIIGCVIDLRGADKRICEASCKREAVFD